MNILIITDKPVKDPNVVVNHGNTRIRYVNPGYQPCGEGYIIVVKEYQLTPSEQVWFDNTILTRMVEGGRIYNIGKHFTN